MKYNEGSEGFTLLIVQVSTPYSSFGTFQGPFTLFFRVHSDPHVSLVYVEYDHTHDHTFTYQRIDIHTPVYVGYPQIYV